MNTSLDEFDDSVEAQLTRLQPRVAVDGLRDATLGRVQRELRASRWDRRLGRVAAVLLVVGFSMNIATVSKRPALPAGGRLADRLADRPTAESIAKLGVTMADVTDIKTASIIAQHWAALNGLPLGSHQTDAIEHEIGRRLSSALSNGKDG